MPDLEIRIEKKRLVVGPSDTPLALLEFRRVGRGRLVVEHTLVTEALQGQGFGRKLVARVVALAREEKRTIASECPYAATVLARDPSYADVREAGP